MKIYAITEKGVLKGENEDRIVINSTILSCGSLTAEVEDGIFAIADGVGGHNGGAVASRFVANAVGTLSSLKKETLSNINDELLGIASEIPELSTMATTLAGVSLKNKVWTLFSVGNSRVYQIQNGKYLKQLTTDDTMVQYLLARGQLTKEEIPNFTGKNEITACFGGGNRDLFQIKIAKIEQTPSSFLITSDGVHDFFSVDELEELLKTKGLSMTCCEAIREKALENGSEDDISILIGVI